MPRYQIAGSDGRVVDFEVPYELTESVAREVADMRLEQLDAEEAQLQQAAGSTRGFGEFLGDVGLGLGTGALGLVQTAGDIGQLLGSDEVAKSISESAKSGQEYLQGLKSEKLQAQEQLFQRELAAAEGEGFLSQLGTGAGELLSNPALLFQMAVEQLPNFVGMGVGGFAAKGIARTAIKEATEQTLARAGVAGAVGTAAAMQGADVGMSTYDRVYEELVNQGVSEAEAAQQAMTEAQGDAIQAGLVTIGTTALIPGAATIEKAIAGRSLAQAAGVRGAQTLDRARMAAPAAEVTATAPSYLRRGALGGLGEFTQEASEEGLGRLISNISAIQAGADIDPMQGVGTAAGVGGVLGGILGGGISTIDTARERRAFQEEAGRLQAAREATDKAQRDQEAARVAAERQAQADAAQARLAESQAATKAAVAATGATEEWFPNLETPERIARVDEELKGVDTNPEYADFSADEKAKIKADLKKLKAKLKAQEAVDKPKAAESAFADAEEDLFGIKPTATRQAAPVQPAEAAPETATEAAPEEGVQGTLDLQQPQDFDVDTLAANKAMPKKGSKRYTTVATQVANLDFETQEGIDEAANLAADLENQSQNWAQNLSEQIKQRVSTARERLGPAAEEQALPVNQVQLNEYVDTYNGAAEGSKDAIRSMAVSDLGITGEQFDAAVRGEKVETAKGPVSVRGVSRGEQKAADDESAAGAGLEVAGVKPESGAAKGPAASEEGGVARGGEPSVRDTGRTRAYSSALDELDEDFASKTTSFLLKAEGTGAQGAGAAARRLRSSVEDALKTVDLEVTEDVSDQGVIEAKIDAVVNQVRKRLTESAKIKPQSMTVDEAVKRLAPLNIKPTPKIRGEIAAILRANKTARAKQKKDFTAEDQQRLIGKYVAETMTSDTVDKAVAKLKAELNKPSPIRAKVRMELEAAKSTLTRMQEIKTQAKAQKKVEVATTAQKVREAGKAQKKEDVGFISVGAGVAVEDAAAYRKLLDGVEKRVDRQVKITRGEAAAEAFGTIDEDTFTLGERQDQIDQEVSDTLREEKTGQLRRKTARNAETVQNYLIQEDKATDEDVERLVDAIEMYTDEQSTEEERIEAKGIIDEFNETYLDDALAWSKKAPRAKLGFAKTPYYKDTAELRRAIEQKFDKRALDAAIRSGRVVLLESMNDPKLDPEIRAAVEAGVEEGFVAGAFVHPNANNEPVVYLVASNMNPAEAIRTVIHEAGVHAGWRGVMGEQNYMQAENFIRQTIRRVEKQKGPMTKAERVIYDAYKMVKTRYKIAPSEVMEEVLAHVVDQHVDIPLYRRAISAIRNWLRSIGLMPKLPLTPEDLAGIARRVASNWMLRGDAVKAARKGPMMSAREGILDAIGNYGGKVGEAPSPESLVDKATKLGQKIGYKEVDGKMVPKTAEDYRASGRRKMDKILTRTLSADAAANREIRRRLRDNAENMSDAEAEIVGRMLEISTSQTFHAEGVASNFLEYGNVVYDDKLHKWIAEKTDANYATLMQAVEEYGKANDLTGYEAQRALHYYLEAKRLKSLYNDTRAKRKELELLKAENKGDSKRAKQLRKTLKERKLHRSEADVDAFLSNFNESAEAKKVVDIWNQMRENAIKIMVKSGTVTEEKAETWLDNVDYVPFQRESQLEAKQGMPDYMSGLVNKYMDKRLKGSENEVNDIFDNMAAWTEYAVEAAVRNYSANRLMKEMVKLGMAQEVTAASSIDRDVFENNKVEIYMDGTKKIFVADDPLFLEAFQGQEGLGIPFIKQSSWFTNFLRKSVVLNPIFSIGQLSQDAFGAMFTSGLSPMQAIKIPYQVLKEFIKTLRGTSEAHEYLKRVASVGIKDYSAAVVVRDIEARLGKMKNKGRLGRTMDWLENFSMASDNAVRQAVYNLSLADGTSQAEAVERSFEIINFRRKGSSPLVHMGARFIPFFNAYLQSMNVQLNTLAGEGISPKNEKSRMALAKIIAMNTSLMMLYSMMMGGDEDYEELDPMYRDRMLMLPGSGGLGIPLRTDLFLLPKIIAEHGYRLMTDNTMEDGRTFRDAISVALANGLFSPTAVPQVIKPIVEVTLDKNFFTGRNLVSQQYADLPPYLQQTEFTSELSNWLGEATKSVFGGGGISPIKVDHLIRGYTGSVGGMVLWTSNLMGDFAGVRPSKSMQDYIAGLPGVSRFVNKEEGTGLRSYYYDMARDVNEAYREYLTIKANYPDKLDPFLEDTDKVQRVAMAKGVRDLSNRLAKIRSAIKTVSASTGDPEEQQQMIADLRALENELLSNINLKGLRERAGRSTFF